MSISSLPFLPFPSTNLSFSFRTRTKTRQKQSTNIDFKNRLKTGDFDKQGGGLNRVGSKFAKAQKEWSQSEMVVVCASECENIGTGLASERTTRAMSLACEPWTWMRRPASSKSFLLIWLMETPSVCKQRRRSFIGASPPGRRRSPRTHERTLIMAFRCSAPKHATHFDLPLPRLSRQLPQCCSIAHNQNRDVQLSTRAHDVSLRPTRSDLFTRRIRAKSNTRLNSPDVCQTAVAPPPKLR